MESKVLEKHLFNIASDTQPSDRICEPEAAMLMNRSCGILLPISSLPSKYGIGDFGDNAYRFAEFLSKAGQGIWQVLPLHPTSPALGNSPYSSSSAFAGNTLFIDPERLVRENLLTENDLKITPEFDNDEVEYDKLYSFKENLLKIAYKKFASWQDKGAFEQFCREQSSWLEDFALYIALKEKFGYKTWTDWPEPYRDRQPDAIEKAKSELAERIDFQKFSQFVFFAQWQALKAHCNNLGIIIVGDIPIYVNTDSADTWSNQELFDLGPDKKPTHVAGVPPDYFSATGQLWGNPVYDWNRLKETGFDWWLKRLGHMFWLYDVLRIDHFRGLIAYWEVPAGEKTAVNGQWQPVPYEDFFKAVESKFDGAAIMAEDLGTITEDVHTARKKYAYPGMKILQFAFGSDDPKHPYLPHNYEKDFVVYTGTHDNNTVRGWFENETRPEDRQRLFRYLGHEVAADKIPTELIRLAYASIADWAVVPLQDVLGLGREARINLPASANGNWKWRLHPELLTDKIAQRMHDLSATYGRLPK